MERLLLHICCAPCSAYAVPAFREEAGAVVGFFYNPNIHPEEEYQRRREALERYATVLAVPVVFADGSSPAEYFRAVDGREEDRCRQCFALRLRGTAREARRRGCGAFSTTLLSSIYQRHDLIRAAGEAVAAEIGIPFLYRDLRPGWQEGCDRYRESGLFRQRYCGCVFSERERREQQHRKRERRERQRAGAAGSSP